MGFGTEQTICRTPRTSRGLSSEIVIWPVGWLKFTTGANVVVVITEFFYGVWPLPLCWTPPWSTSSAADFSRASILHPAWLDWMFSLMCSRVTDTCRSPHHFKVAARTQGGKHKHCPPRKAQKVISTLFWNSTSAPYCLSKTNKT